MLLVVGAGYVGLTAAAVFADQGHDVVLIESDPRRFEILAAGEAPFHEPELTPTLQRARATGRLRVAPSLRDALGADAGTEHRALIAIIAVGTPAGANGATDESQLLAAASEIGAAASSAGHTEVTLVIKSTAPVGAAERAATAARSAAVATRSAAVAAGNGAARAMNVAVVVNPEFLRSGHAVHDFLHPDRVVIGGSDDAAVGAVASLYQGFVPAGKIMRMSAESASLVKYAANAMLATRISFMNELAALATAVGADIEEVRRGVGADPRIGGEHLHAGLGYGGSCLPKDVASLVALGASHEVTLGVVRAVAAANDHQPELPLASLRQRLGSLGGKRIAVWGLAFKGGADDFRDSPGISLARSLVAEGASVVAFDPSLTGSAEDDPRRPSDITLVESAEGALQRADAVVITADWPQFRSVAPALFVSALAQPIVVDGRNLFDPATMRAAGVHYIGVGRGERP